MTSTYGELNSEWNNQKEVKDKEELRIFDTFLNNFTNKIEHNDCLTLKIQDKIYQGSDKQFEEILQLFPNHTFKRVSDENKFVTLYKGHLGSNKNYFTLNYNGGWISKFDCVQIELSGSKEEFELIKDKYNL